MHGRKFPRTMQARQLDRIPAIGLYPITRTIGDQRRGDYGAVDPELGQTPGVRKPLGPAS